MNDQIDDTTQVSPTPEPAAASPGRLDKLDLSQWRRIAIGASSLFVVTLALLGWQVAADDDHGKAGQRFDGRGGPGAMGSGQQFQGGPPQMGGQGSQQDGQQSQSAPPSTRSS